MQYSPDKLLDYYGLDNDDQEIVSLVITALLCCETTAAAAKSLAEQLRPVVEHETDFGN